MQTLDGTSPQPARKAQNSRKESKHNSATAPQSTGAMSDSNLPPSKTPKSKKIPRQKPQGADLGNPQKTRPASVTAPNASAIATPSKAAYAGPTFHASPAPSSLPVPRFFSKSVPGPDTGLQARLDNDTDKEEGFESDTGRLAPPTQNIQQSPLDMFFHADRQERAKRQSSSGLSCSQPRVKHSDTPERPRLGQDPSNSGRDMFMMELDEGASPSTDRTARPAPPGPPRRMTSERSRTAPENVPTLSHEDARNAEYTKSLKDLLGLTLNGAPSSSASPVRPQSGDSQGSPFHANGGHQHAQDPSTPQRSMPPLHYGNRNLSPLFQAARQDSPTRPSALRQEYHPSPDNPAQMSSVSNNNHSAIARAYLQQQTGGMQPRQAQPIMNASPSRDVKSMEENLRRMLKLDTP